MSQKWAVVAATVAMPVGAIASLPSNARAGNPPARFCPTWKVISHNPHTDRTRTHWDTFEHVKHIEENYVGGFFNRCFGVVGVGLEIEEPRTEPIPDWVISVSILARDVPSRKEPSFIEGVRIVFRLIAEKPPYLM